MDHSRVARTVLDAVGGTDNITAAAHCATRLRLVLHDEDKVNQDALDRDEDIKGTFSTGGMYQVIIGPGDVDTVFAKLIASGVSEATTDELKETAVKKQNLFSRFVKVIADIFVPMLPALIAGGLTMSLTNVLTAEGLFGDASVVQNAPWLTDYAAMLALIAAAVFAALPVLIGFSAVKRFGGNPYLGTALGAAMVSPDLVNAYAQVDAEAEGTLEYWQVFGLEVSQVGYQGQVLPMIAVAWFLAAIEKRLHKWLSGTTDFLVTPLVTLIISGFLAFVVVGPVMRTASDVITEGLLWSYTNGFIFGGMLFGLVYSPIVVTGLHQSFPAIELPMIADVAGTGGSFIMAIAAAANVAQAAAAFAVFLRTRNAKFKALSGASSVSAIFGITEPAIFGVNLRLKWPFFCAMVGGAAGGTFAALFDLRNQALGSAGILTTVSIIPSDIPMLLVTLAIAFGTSFAVTMAYALTRGKASLEEMDAMSEDALPLPGEQDSQDSTASADSAGTAATATAHPDTETSTVAAPLQGTVVPLADVPDAGFASGAVGKGVAVDPTGDTVTAPADGEVIMTFPTGHAVGVRLDNGIDMLIHIGLDTVNMEGEGFTVHVSKGDRVQAGTPLITFSREAIESAGFSALTPVLVVNHRKFHAVSTASADGAEAATGDPLLHVDRVVETADADERTSP